jgi:2-oxoglutarate ferredoxin oxidoreductase subunit beta
MTSQPQKTAKDYSTKEVPSWCPGCGDFGILTSLKKALAEENKDPDEVLVVAGIGCGSLLPYWVNTYGACTLHGRAIPFATGAKIANHKNTVIVNVGDGDGLGIGMGHFIHFFRRNFDMVTICDNNGVYGLTKGQTSPTAKKGTKTSSTPFGSIEDYVNGAALALQMGATFVARAYSADSPGLTEIIRRAMQHRGSAFIDILQPCVTFNKVETYMFYNKHIEKKDLSTPLCKTREEAIQFCNTPQEKIPTGIFFQEQAPTYEDEIPQLRDGPLAERDIMNIDASDFMKRRA